MSQSAWLWLSSFNIILQYRFTLAMTRYSRYPHEYLNYVLMPSLYSDLYPPRANINAQLYCAHHLNFMSLMPQIGPLVKLLMLKRLQRVMVGLRGVLRRVCVWLPNDQRSRAACALQKKTAISFWKAVDPSCSLFEEQAISRCCAAYMT